MNRVMREAGARLEWCHFYHNFQLYKGLSGRLELALKIAVCYRTMFNVEDEIEKAMKRSY